jgi:hypothetical protein
MRRSRISQTSMQMSGHSPFKWPDMVFPLILRSGARRVSKDEGPSVASWFSGDTKYRPETREDALLTMRV